MDPKLIYQKLKKEQLNNLIIHFDESDYGTDKKGILGKIIEFILVNKIPIRLYSATNEEILFSQISEDKEYFTSIPKFIPSTNYCGASWFFYKIILFSKLKNFGILIQKILLIKDMNYVNSSWHLIIK